MRALTLLLATTAALLSVHESARAQTEVPSDWSLIPSGLGGGDEFRLLFISSTTRDASSTDIADYNTHVENAAAAGHTDIQSYSTGFRVVACTLAKDAVDNTSTTGTGTGVSIYWLNGNKVADSYTDFYDGTWDDETSPKNESGTAQTWIDSASLSEIFTGCENTGTRHFSYYLGNTGLSSLLPGTPDQVTIGELADSGGDPIEGDTSRDPSHQGRFYGLSEVFQVVAVAPGKPTGLTVGTVTPTKIPLSWTAPTSTGGADISNYTMERAPDVSGSAGTWATIWMGNRTSHTDGDLTPETTYHYRVSAINSAGTGTASDSTSGTTAAAPMVPAAPSFLSVTAHATTTPGSIQLRWNFPFGSPTRTSVEFRASTDSGVNWSHAVTDDWPNFTADSRAITFLAGLTPGTAYTFEVRGRNADGPGPAAQVTGTTAAAVSITGVALTSNPAMGTTYDTGEDVVATLTFSRPVTFAEVGGNLPQLELDFGGTGKPATCAATNQQTAVVCTYTVVAGDAAPAGVAIGANKLTLNGGTIRLGSGAHDTNLDYTVPLAHTALAADTDHKVSATTVPPGPTVDSIAFNSAGVDGAFKTGDAVTATVTFSEAVTVDTTGGTPQLDFNVGRDPKVLTYNSGSGSTALVFTGYTVAVNDEDTDGLSVEANKLILNSGAIKATAGANPDAVLTHAAVADSASHKVDGVKPTLVTTGDNAPKTSLDGMKIILTFSEDIGSVDFTNISLQSGMTFLGTLSASKSGSTVEITLTTALASTATNITVALSAGAVTDVPGNGNDAVAATTVIRVSAPGPPVLTAAAKTESIELTWTIADHGSSDITRFEYRIKQTTGGTYPATWTDTGAAASNTGGSATIGSLTNGTQYTVQVRGVNSEGEGADSNEPTATPDAPPEITSVAITSDPGTDKTYAIRDDIVVTLTFDKNITVSGTGADPSISINIGTEELNPGCEVGTAPTKDLVCTRTVYERLEDSDGRRSRG